MFKKSSGKINRLNSKSETFFHSIIKFRFSIQKVYLFMLAGPVGISITKGTDFASIIVMSTGEKTHIRKLSSDREIVNGNFEIKDVTFSTNGNMIAAKGWMNINTDSSYFTFAILDKNGCSILNHHIYDSFSELEMDKVKVVSAILVPVTNLVSDIFGSDCEVFYNGAVKHPE